ncbi:MAG: DUF2007 domain-containing protein [Candidatus Marinimicrobia bacterium]|nr:DUF2007 domain-containing protein [Candidatus Neomarinimicrobiota bacterium]
MKCPECNTEYQNEIEICTKCGVSLVSNLPDDEQIPEISWVKLGPISNRIYAEMIGGALHNNSIPHYVKADFHNSAFGIISGNLAGSNVFVFVPENFKEKTQDVIEEITGI